MFFKMSRNLLITFYRTFATKYFRISKTTPLRLLTILNKKVIPKKPWVPFSFLAGFTLSLQMDSNPSNRKILHLSFNENRTPEEFEFLRHLFNKIRDRTRTHEELSSLVDTILKNTNIFRRNTDENRNDYGSCFRILVFWVCLNVERFSYLDLVELLKYAEIARNSVALDGVRASEWKLNT